MDKVISEKMDALLKYVPFIDFLLNLDKQKYIKFTNIKKWIILKKKKYPLSDLNKIEKSIITQYQNLLIDNRVHIPASITQIFAPLKFKEYVNLCSDDDDDGDGDENNRNTNKIKECDSRVKVNERITNFAKSKLKKEFPTATNSRNPSTDGERYDDKDDDDDDIEIISIDYIEKQRQTANNSSSSNNVGIKDEYDLNEQSKDLLSRIDKLNEDERKSKIIVHEPINYCYNENDYNDNATAEAPIQNSDIKTDSLYQSHRDFKEIEIVPEKTIEPFNRRTDFKDEIVNDNVENKCQRSPENEDVLFERRTNFKNKNHDDVVVVENLIKSSDIKICNTRAIETISLDSGSEDELYNDAPSTSKAAATAVAAATVTSKTKKSSSPNEVNIKENTKPTPEKDTTAAVTESKVNNNQKLNSLSDSVDLGLDMLNELHANIQANTAKEDNVIEKNCVSNKENLIQSPAKSANDPPVEKPPHLTYEQLCKLLETALDNIDMPFDSILSILSNSKIHVVNDNCSTETPPPAPPATINTANVPLHVNAAVPFQQKQQHSTHLTYNPNITEHLGFQSYAPHQPNIVPPPVQQFANSVHQNQITNVGLAPQIFPPGRKLNFKDPRIQKQLQAIQKSPLFNYNLINTEIAESIMNICRSQAGQDVPKLQQHEQPQHTMNNLTMYQRQNLVSNKTITNCHQKKPYKSSTQTVSTINYAEYKRRNLEKKRLEEEKRKAEEEEKKKKTEVEEKKKAEEEKEKKKAEEQKLNEEKLREQLFSTLKTCKDQITTMWKQHKNTESNTREENEAKQNSIAEEEESNNSNNGTKNAGKAKCNKNKINSSEDKLNRVYRELHCTVKGFDQLHDYLPKTFEEKRCSSMQARESIRNQLNCNNPQEGSCVEMDSIVEKGQKESTTPRPIGLKRRSSLHALSAITNHLSNTQTEDFDIIIDHGQAIGTQSCKRRKTIDEIIKPTKRCQSLRLESSESSTSSEDASDTEDLENLKKLKEYIIKNPGYVKLQRISQELIRKHTKCKSQEHTQNRLNVQLVKMNEKKENAQNSIEPIGKKSTNKPSRFNNNCQMTERNTHFCVLCTSKPSDLTNHYIRKHKTESYVSRLDWSELDDLQISPPFAKLQLQTSGNRVERYTVECPFCKEQVTDAFMNLYNHYASHTGEFAYQCSHCHLLKPYRADIQSHLLHSKTCRNSHVQTMYRYPPDSLCIYLHYCDICNFVQLNEANVIKHIREHHHSSKAIAKNVGKCILAAISDGPCKNISPKSKTPSLQPTTSAITKVAEQTVMPLKAKSELELINDDEIPIGNEPCSEDVFDENKISLEDQIRKIHDDLPNIQNIPMTVVHYTDNLRNNLPDSEQLYNPSNSISTQREYVKVEALEINETVCTTPPPMPSTNRLAEHCAQSEPRTSISKPKAYEIYERYRSYPPTVDYLGLYKCMIDDCYYSTDHPTEILKHFTDHTTDSTTNEYLQCPYCIIPMDKASPLTAEQLVEHIRLKHEHMKYQCSLCCYRSCEASNVLVHQSSHHRATNLNSCKIYKFASNNEQSQRERQIDLNELIKNNVLKVSCSSCQACFYNSNLLSKHFVSAHKVSRMENLILYSCIYCPKIGNSIEQLKLHVATKHPEETPYIYDYNGQVNKTEDCLTSLNVINLTESVPYVEFATKAVVQQNVAESIVLQDNEDVKPNLMQLQQMNEETIKVRLRKLTTHTGVPPDTLYRCPISSCGGFFSIFDLWLKHMSLRHCVLECECPHCPAAESTTSPTMLSLESFRTHFEVHRRHTYLCFYCAFTCRNEQIALEHANQEHAEFGAMRFEYINFNINYSYLIMIQQTLFTKREDFINELLVITEQRLKDMDTMEQQLIKSQWPLSNSALSSAWLENVHKLLFSNRKSILRCLVRECNFRSFDKATLFQHLLAAHEINGSTFSCTKCNYRLEKFNSFDQIYDHISIHSESIFICAACSLNSSSRSKISLHIMEQHAARDVAVVQLLKMKEQVHNKIYITFATDHLTFSTMKNCFCCPEKNMNGNVLSLHLKRYHNLVLTHYCEKCTNLQFKSLGEVKGHFEQFHMHDHIRIRCELAAKSDLSVIALNEFQVEISKENHQHHKQNNDKDFLVNIKEEPHDPKSDDSIMLMEDDDIIVENSLKNNNQIKKIPQLKCRPLDNLINAPAILNLSQQQVRTSQDHGYMTNQQQQQQQNSSTRMLLPLPNSNSNNNNNALNTSALNIFNNVPTNSNQNVSSTVNSISYVSPSGGIARYPRSVITNYNSQFSNPTGNSNGVSGNGINNRKIINQTTITYVPRPTLSSPIVVQLNSTNNNNTRTMQPNFNYVYPNAHPNTISNHSASSSQVSQPGTSNHQYVFQHRFN